MNDEFFSDNAGERDDIDNFADDDKPAANEPQ